MSVHFNGLRRTSRILWKNPGFSTVAICALALGIGANTAIFSVVNGVLLKPLPYPEADRLVFVARQFPDGSTLATSVPKFNKWQSVKSVYSAMAAYNFSGSAMSLTGDSPEQVTAIHASAGFFQVFGARFAIGRTFTPEEDAPNGPQVAVISDGLWKRRFGGDPSAVGKTLVLNGEPYILIGVLGGEFRPNPKADVWIPLAADPNSSNQGNYLLVAARLAPGVSVSLADVRMKLAGEEFRRDHPAWISPGETSGVTRMQAEITGDIRPLLLVLSGAVGFVLLIACANVANLLLARASGRRREIAIRTAIGAGRGSIIRLLLGESAVLGGAAGILGLAIGSFGVRALLAVVPGDLPRIDELNSWTTVLDWRVLAFTGFIALATTVLFGLFPALQLSKTDLNASLKAGSGRGSTGRGHNRARGILVTVEVALALTLVIAAALLVRTFVELRSVKPGLEARNVLTMQIPLAAASFRTSSAVARFDTQLVERLEAMPGIVSAASTITLPFDNGLEMSFVIEGKPPAQGQFNGDEPWNIVGAHYFETLRIGLRRGRLFQQRDDGAGEPVVIINEAFARKYFAGQDPLGHRIHLGTGLGPDLEDPVRTIIGVVADTRERGLEISSQSILYTPMAQMKDRLSRFVFSVLPNHWLIRTAGDPLAMARAVELETGKVDRQAAAAKFRSLDQVVADSTARQSFNGLLLAIFGGIALTLAAVGIYGLLSYMVAQRTHEIGIRMALGGNRGAMLRMIAWEGLRFAGAGVAIGLVGSMALTRLLRSMLFGVRSDDPATFAGVAAALLMVALLAALGPAYRAAKVDPIIALRQE